MTASQISYAAGARHAYDPGNGAVVAGPVPAGPGIPWEGEVSDHCARIKEDGERCGAPAVRGKDFCIGHLRQLQE